MDDVVTKTFDATVQPVESEHPDGEFKLILSRDNTDRDGDNLWADEWAHPLPERLHFDTDHAFTRGMSVPFTAGSGVPEIAENGDLIVTGTYAPTPHGQLTRQLVNGKHVWGASVTYQERILDDGRIVRDLLNGTFTGVPSNPQAVVLSSKDIGTKKSGGTTEGQYESSEGPFADPKNRKWPLNSAARVRNAWARIHQEHATVNYSASELATMRGRIRSAARRYGIELSDDSNSKSLVLALCKAITKTSPGWMLTQSNPGHTVAGEDVGARSVYDDALPEEEDIEEEEGEHGMDEDHGSIAQAVHDAAVSLGASCSSEQCATSGGCDTKSYELSLITAGPPGEEVYTVYHDGKTLGHGKLADLHLKALPGAPTGPYQGVEGMSGENATGTEPGTSIEEGQLFLGGTAGPVVTPELKSLPSADGAAAAAQGAAAAVTPADLAASARLRKFKMLSDLTESEAS